MQVPDIISPKSTTDTISTAPDPVPSPDLPKIDLAPLPTEPAKPATAEKMSVDDLFGPIEEEEAAPVSGQSADPLANPYTSFKPTV